MEYENIIFEMDFLGEGAADLCAGEFLVPLAAGKLFPPVQIKPEEVHYDSLKRCLIQMEELCETKENAYTYFFTVETNLWSGDSGDSGDSG